MEARAVTARKKHKPFKLRSRTRLVALAKCFAPCVLHPKGGHDIVIYGFTRRRAHVRPVLWQQRWYRTLNATPWLTTKNARRSAAAKYVFVKFIDFKWCPYNTKTDRPLHRAARMLGVPTCRAFVLNNQRTASFRYRSTPMLWRQDSARTFLNRLFARLLPQFTNVRLTTSGDGRTRRANIQVVCQDDQRRQQVTFVLWCKVNGPSPIELNMPFSANALHAYVQRFLLNAGR